MGAVLTTNPSTGMAPASMPAVREAAQSPITIVGTSGAGISVTISNSAPVDAWIVPTNSFSRMARVALGFSTATYSLALARPSATNTTGGCWGVARTLTGVRSFTFR